jgi:hypothetical protein
VSDLSLSQVHDLAGETGYLRSYLDLAVDSCGGAPVHHLAVALTSLAVALCAGEPAYSHLLDPIQKLYPHLYRVSLGPSGGGKTRAERLAQHILYQALPEAILPMDFSREALYDTLADHPAGYLGVDEFKGLQDRLNREYNLGAREFLTEAFDSPPLIKRRTKAGEVEIHSPRINLTAGSTREWFEEAVRSGDFEGGWLSRFIYVSANDILPLKKPQVADAHVILDQLAQHLQIVAQLGGPANFSAVEAEAWPYMESIHNRLGQVDSQIRGFWASINTNAIKLATIFHVSDSPQDLDIQPEDWSRATFFMDMMVADVRQLTSEVAYGHTGKELNRLRRLIRPATEGINRRDLLRNSKMKAREFDSYVSTLEQTGETHRHQMANTQGSPSVYFYPGGLCPKCSRNGVNS